MRRLLYPIINLSLLFFINCAPTIPLTEADKTYQKIIEFDLAKDEIFIRSLDWATSAFTGSHQLVFKTTLLDQGSILETGVQSKDKESGTILSNGYVEIVTFPVLKIKYSCRIDCKEKKVRMTFNNFQYYFDAGVNMRSWADVNKGMVDKLIPELDKLSSDFKKKMNSNTLDSDW